MSETKWVRRGAGGGRGRGWMVEGDVCPVGQGHMRLMLACLCVRWGGGVTDATFPLQGRQLDHT